MKTIHLHNSVVCYDEYGLEEKPNLQAFLKMWNLEKVLEQVKQDITLVLGWDGTMLRALRDNYMEARPFLWVNFWHKWFLLNDKNWIWKNNKGFITREYPLIEVKNKWEKIGTWFNDIHLYSPNGKLIKLDVANSFWSISLSWDGVIISTPAWSTWHSKSYGWPVLLHDTKGLIITPKWNLTSEPAKVIPDSHPVKIKNTGRQFELWVNIDGVQILESDLWEEVDLEISKSSQKVELLISAEHESNWDNKLMAEQGFSS